MIATSKTRNAITVKRQDTLHQYARVKGRKSLKLAKRKGNLIKAALLKRKRKRRRLWKKRKAVQIPQAARNQI